MWRYDSNRWLSCSHRLTVDPDWRSRFRRHQKRTKQRRIDKRFGQRRFDEIQPPVTLTISPKPWCKIFLRCIKEWHEVGGSNMQARASVEDGRTPRVAEICRDVARGLSIGNPILRCEF